MDYQIDDEDIPSDPIQRITAHFDYDAEADVNLYPTEVTFTAKVRSFDLRD